jgi:hypothetical protein
VSVFPSASAQAVAFLRDLGAAELVRPGGSLLARLQRVQEQLAAWGARPALRLAGLCHAYYGTDGFHTALLSLDRRAELAAVIGATGSPVTLASPNLNAVTTSPS